MATKKKTTAPEAEVNDTPVQDPEAQAPAQTPEPDPAQAPASEAPIPTPEDLEKEKNMAPGDKGIKVQVITPVAIIRSGPGQSFEATMTVRKGGVYTIAEENDGWGRLANGAGWIKLTRVQAVETE